MNGCGVSEYEVWKVQSIDIENNSAKIKLRY